MLISLEPLKSLQGVLLPIKKLDYEIKILPTNNGITDIDKIEDSIYVPL